MRIYIINADDLIVSKRGAGHHSSGGFRVVRKSKSRQLRVPATSVTCSPSRSAVTGFLLSALSGRMPARSPRSLISSVHLPG
jgi:hypothetical protein